jgi:hypothetical protein
MNIDFLNEKQNSSTLLVIFVVKSIEIEILNNGTAKRKLKRLQFSTSSLFVKI